MKRETFRIIDENIIRLKKRKRRKTQFRRSTRKK